MNIRTRLDTLEARLDRESAHPRLLEILREYREAAGDETPLPERVTTAEALRLLAQYLPV